MASEPAPDARERLAVLNKDLTDILGMMCFSCGPIAEAFRSNGATIPRRAEDEQAYVIHWLLGLYLAHGAGWRKIAAAEVRDMADAIAAKFEGKDRAQQEARDDH